MRYHNHSTVSEDSAYWRRRDGEREIGQTDQWLQVQTASGAAGHVAAWLVTDIKQEMFPPAG